MSLLIPAHPGSPGQSRKTAVCVLLYYQVSHSPTLAQLILTILRSISFIFSLTGTSYTHKIIIRHLITRCAVASAGCYQPFMLYDFPNKAFQLQSKTHQIYAYDFGALCSSATLFGIADITLPQ